MLSALIIILAVAAKDPEMPKHWEEYPKDAWHDLLGACIHAGKAGGYDDQKMDGYCSCHLFFMIESTPYSEFSELKKKNDLDKLFARAHNACLNLGFHPGKPEQKEKPKREPKPTNPLRTRPGTSVT